MVLFMCREYERIKYFTTGDGRVVTKVRIDQPASIINDSIYEFTTLANLSHRFCRRINGKIFQFVCPFEISIRAHLNIFNDFAIFYYSTISDCSVITMEFIMALFGKIFEFLLYFF